MARHSSTYRCNRPRVRTGAARRTALREQRLATLVAQAVASVPATPAEEPVAEVVDLAEQRRQRKNELARVRRAAKKLAA